MMRMWPPQQGADLGDVGLASGTRQQAVIPDTVEPVGQDMDQKATDELGLGQSHDLLSVAALDPVVLPAEGDSIDIGADQAVVRDRHHVSIAA